MIGMDGVGIQGVENEGELWNMGLDGKACTTEGSGMILLSLGV